MSGQSIRTGVPAPITSAVTCMLASLKSWSSAQIYFMPQHPFIKLLIEYPHLYVPVKAEIDGSWAHLCTVPLYPVPSLEFSVSKCCHLLPSWTSPSLRYQLWIPFSLILHIEWVTKLSQPTCVISLNTCRFFSICLCLVSSLHIFLPWTIVTIS